MCDGKEDKYDHPYILCPSMPWDRLCRRHLYLVPGNIWLWLVHDALNDILMMHRTRWFSSSLFIFFLVSRSWISSPNIGNLERRVCLPSLQDELSNLWMMARIPTTTPAGRPWYMVQSSPWSMIKRRPLLNYCVGPPMDVQMSKWETSEAQIKAASGQSSSML